MNGLKEYEPDVNSDMIEVECGSYYRIDEADETISKLTDRCRMHDFFWDGCGFAKRGFKNTIAVSDAFDNLEAENRRLRRALWLARANRAMAESYSVLNDVLTSNRWVKTLNKLKAKAEEYK